MRRRTTTSAPVLLLLGAAMAGCAADATPTEATESRGADLMISLLRFSIDSIEPAVPEEGSPVTAPFTVTNRTSKTVSGSVQGNVLRSVGGTNATTSWFISVPAYSTQTGVLTFTAPPGAPGNALNAFLADSLGNHLATAATQSFDTSAHRQLSITVTQGNPRGKADMAFVGVSVARDGALTDSLTSSSSTPQGNGTVVFQSVTKDFDFVPSDPGPSFTVGLAGEDEFRAFVPGQDVSNWIAHVEAAANGLAVGTISAGQDANLDTFLDPLDPTTMCNGPLFATSRTYTAQQVNLQLDEFVPLPGYASPIGCGATSNYLAQIESLHAPSAALVVTPPVAAMTSTGRQTFTANKQVSWSVDGGATIGQISPSGGTFTPGPDLPALGYATVRATPLDGSASATAFVQLEKLVARLPPTQ